MNYLPRELWNYLEEPPEGIQGSYAYQALHGYLRWVYRQEWNGYGMSVPQVAEADPEIWLWLNLGFSGSRALYHWDRSLSRIDCYVIAVSYIAILQGWDLLSLLTREDRTYNKCCPNFRYAGMIAASMGRLNLTRRIIAHPYFLPHAEAFVRASSIDAKFAKALRPHLETADPPHEALMAFRDDVELFLALQDMYPNVRGWARYLELLTRKPVKILAYVKEHGL